MSLGQQAECFLSKKIAKVPISEVVSPHHHIYIGNSTPDGLIMIFTKKLTLSSL
jgi:hypothetical protein